MNGTTDEKLLKRSPKMDRTVIDSAASSGFDDAEGTAVETVQLMPGVRIEQYELIRELGRGGMGQVFLARDTRLGRHVAMKFMQSTSPRFAQRWLAEAHATARCHHENIVTIFGADNFAGMPYMVLEYIEGSSLKKLMADRRMPPNRTIELMVPVVRALARAHEQNIIHRDLKPENIVVTKSGTVKVLDFGVAKLASLGGEESGTRPRARTASDNMTPVSSSTRAGAIVGTLPYMSPEQLGTDSVDHRSDLWAVGIIFYEMLAAKHPLDPLTEGRLFGAAAAVDEPMPSIADDVVGLPEKLVQIVARCLAKKKTERYASAKDLLADLETLLPARTGRSLVADESPYPGLTAFQEADANRFFGRSRDIAETVARLRDRPLVGIVGPSGVGKSSFVRAGVVPALKSSGESWEVHIIRPGRDPMTALASTLESLRDTRDSDVGLQSDPAAHLRREPGHFGSRLRSRARRRRTQILVFVDQFEELYTLVGDPIERTTFTTCLASAGDDPASPVRVVISLRSDFLDRVAEDRRFLDEVTRGLVFLQQPNRGGLDEALTQPVEMLGYKFEQGIVPSMLDALEATPGPLPLLQFSAAKLWMLRDKTRRLLTREAYMAMGGVAGALATHADEVLATFTAQDQKTIRAIFQRLVTPERTRAIIDKGELREIADDVERVIGRLVEARLLVVQTRGDSESAVELVHESLIRSWPTLQRWLDENQEHAAYLHQVGVAAKQWDAKGRPAGLLWTGEAMEEARLFRLRYTGELPARERAFLQAVDELATRATRRKRRMVVATMMLLSLVAVAGVGAAFMIREQKERAEYNEQEAVKQRQLAEDSAKRAMEKTELANQQTAIAEQAKAELKAQNKALTDAIDAERAARSEAKASDRAKTRAEQRAANEKLKAAKAIAEREAAKAKAAADAEAKRREREKQIAPTLK